MRVGMHISVWQECAWVQLLLVDSLRTRQKDTKVYRLSLREMTRNRHTLSTLAQNTTFHHAAISHQSVHSQLAQRSSIMYMLVGCRDKLALAGESEVCSGDVACSRRGLLLD